VKSASSPRSVAVIQASALARRLTDTPCARRGQWWAQREAAVEHLEGQHAPPPRITEAALPAITVCESCAVRELCAARARLDRYTGIAAGAQYRNGRRLMPKEPP